MKKCGQKCVGHWIAWVLVIIGALNWGLVGIGNFAGGNWDLVQIILGSVEWLRDVVYILVGLGGLMMLFGCRCKKCSTCRTEDNGAMPSQPEGGMQQ